MTGDPTLTLDNQSLREQNRRLAVILDITAAVSSELDLDRLLRLCVSKITEALDADRTSLFLVDHKNHMLWSKVAQGDGMAEIRFPNGIGIAGHVGTTGETLNIPEAYDDPRFNKSFDVQTGYRTKTILCMPMRDRNQRIFGVVQVLNKRIGHFDAADEDLLATLSAPIVAALENAQLVLEVQKRMERTRVLLDVMRSLSSELDLDRLLVKIMQRITEVMHADRSTLFLIDFKTNQLWSKVAQGVGLLEIRVPIGVGIAGTVAATGETINIPDAYADGRFNQDVDRRTGYHTRTILCMPMRDEHGRVVGVVQCLNKSDGIFTEDDEDLLGALASQANIALSNARLFDEVSYMKNYNESILSSIATGVITFDLEGNVTTANPAAVKIFALGEGEHTGRHFADLVGGSRNERVVEAVQSVFDSRQPHVAYELQYNSASDDVVSLNLNVIPLQTPRGDLLGVVLVAQDITQEQRLMGTLCRYVTQEVAHRVLEDKDALKLGGSKRQVAVLSSDIRGFTTLS
ncbi:MAG: GAF domain-containing protein, partial [Chloroflexi bacterium]|nr:GAF domain-containing protein [Chloroflexota bacterium]